jgi:hypothetical protein
MTKAMLASAREIWQSTIKADIFFKQMDQDMLARGTLFFPVDYIRNK